MNLPVPTDIPAATQHGGPRTPGPGKRNGRPKKKPQAKSVSTTIVLSSPKALKSLKRLAKKAHLTPGALIERELTLSPRVKAPELTPA